MQELQQQFETIQKYISTMFSCLPPVSHYSQDNLLIQSVLYGRKILQLSQKFTAKYRKEHMIDRKDIQERIKEIYNMVYPFSNNKQKLETFTQNKEPINEIVYKILKILKQDIIGPQRAIDRTSNLECNSRVTNQPFTNETIKYKARQTQFVKLQYDQNHNKESANKNCQKLTNLSDVSKKKRSTTHRVNKKSNQLDGKTVLSIHKIFQQEQIEVQKILQKITKILFSNPQINTSSLEQRLYQFQKHEKQFTQQMNIFDLVKQGVKSNINKLHDLQNAVIILDQHFDRKVKMQGYSQGKFNLYLDQINKRQEVYSYSVSKLLQYLSNLRQQVNNKTQTTVNTLTILDNLEQISHKFYDLYPSHSIMKDLKVDKLNKELEKIGFQNQSIQVNIGKSQKAINRQISESRRNLLQLYRVTSRISEFIERFERGIKYKKNIENKQIQKFIQTIKQSLPKKNLNSNGAIPNNIKQQVSNYREELKTLLQCHSKNEKQLTDQFTKKNRKMQKKINQLEKTIQDLMKQLHNEREHRDSEKKKLQKKIETQKQEIKNMHNLNNKLQKSINQLSLQLQRLRSDSREQYDKYFKSESLLKQRQQNLNKELQKNKQKIKKIEQQIQQNIVKYEQQRQIYHKKILILQETQQNVNQELVKTKQELSNMINDNKKLQKQISELSDVYEQKIKELEYVIQNIRELQAENKQLQSQNMNLQNNLKITETKINHEISEKNLMQKQNQRIVRQLECKTEQIEKYRNLAILNENDIQILKQQIQKVKNAYYQADQATQLSKNHAYQIQKDRDRLKKQVRSLKQQKQQQEEQMSYLQIEYKKMEKQLSTYQQQLQLKVRESQGTHKDYEQNRNQLNRAKKDILELKQKLNKSQSEVRKLREEITKKMQCQSIDSSKRKLQIQATKVELRRKTQQLEKQRSHYEQKIGMLQKKNNDLSQLISQKQLLARITNTHLSQ